MEKLQDQDGHNIAYWEGALQAARQEVGMIEDSLYVQRGSTMLSSRLDQFSSLINYARRLERLIRDHRATINYLIERDGE